MTISEHDGQTDIRGLTRGPTVRRRQAVLYDFHGTLADVTGVLPLLRARDYDGFYSQSLGCPAITKTVRATHRSRDAGYQNLLFTGMPRKYEAGLRKWLEDQGVPIDFIVMRRDGDFRKDFVVKREMYLAAVELGYYVVRAWDDSPNVIDLWEGLGIPVETVPGYDLNLLSDRLTKKPDIP